jgi:hypothetical protein
MTKPQQLSTRSRDASVAAVDSISIGRRRVLGGVAGLAGLTALSGCLGPLSSYAARPVVLPADVALERGYLEVHRSEVPLQFSPFPFLGPLVEARSHVRVYATVGEPGLGGFESPGRGNETRPADGGSQDQGTATPGGRDGQPSTGLDGDRLVPAGVDAASLVAFASPEATVAGRPANPLSWTGVRDVVEDLADSSLVTEAGIEGLTWSEAPRHLGSTPGRLLDQETTVETFLGEMTDERGRTNRVAVHAALATVEGTVALALGITGLPSPEDPDDGSVSSADPPSPSSIGVDPFVELFGRLAFDPTD